MSEREPLRRSPSPVWGLTFVVAALTTGLAVTVLDRLGTTPQAPVSIRWWLLAPLFYVSELTVVHLRFNRHAHTFSMTEIPIIVGLHLAAPVELLIGQSIGAAAAFAFHRRQAPVKLAFNTAQFGLQTATAVIVFRAVSAGGPPLGFLSSLGTLLAVLTALLVANVLVNLAIRLSGGHLTKSELADVLVLGSVAALMNGALGLAAVNIVWLRPSSAWLAAVPPAILFVAYRAYVTQRQERSRLSALYDVTRELHRTPQIEAALRAVTTRARSLFEAEVAEVTLVPDQAGGPGFVTGSGAGAGERVMARVPAELVDSLALRAIEANEAVLDGSGSASAMAAPLLEGETVIGAFVVRNPLGDVSAFGPTDLTMLATLAGQVSVSLENGRLEDSLAQLTKLKEELHHQTLHDGLTGLANRRLLHQRLEESVAAASDRSQAALLFLDLDDFKTVNDTLGHEAGDEVLRLAAERLLAACRPRDLVARVGGDEFAVLLDGLPLQDEVEPIASRILEALRRPFLLQGRPVFLSASLGIARVGPGDVSDDVLRRADQAMYAAKWREKGSFELFDESMSEGTRRRLELRQDLRRGLGDGSVRLHYQPVVELETGRIVGAEGLIRWSHPALGRIEPPELLSVAEEAGLMGELAEWTVATAAADLATMRTTRPDFWFSINLSADQLEHGTVDALAAALARNGLGPDALAVEVTETVATQSSEGVLERLSDLGVGIALDDFGTGYSSLARLDIMPIDLLKIDRSFVSRMVSGEDSPLITVMLDIGASLGLDTIAEGVETQDHREALADMGCRYAQGYLFAPAVPLAELMDMATMRDRAVSPPPPTHVAAAR